MAIRSYTGYFKPKNPSKYRGNLEQLNYRSLLERSFMTFCDTNPNVVQWSYETTIIPYICQTDNKWHRYFMDFWVQTKDKDGVLTEALVEIKPKSQTSEPKIKTKKTKRYVEEVMTWVKNSCKWKAAREYCEMRKMKFMLITEEDLRGR